MNTSVKANNLLVFNLPVEHGWQLVRVPIDKVDPALMIARQGLSPSGTDYRNAAMNLLHGNEDSASRIFVTSPRPGDGKTCTAFNLAWALAESGRTVLLVELNFTKPHFRIALGNLRLRYGLENVMRGTVEPIDAVFSVASTELHIAAVRNPTPIGMLQPILEHLDAFLDWGNQNYELLVIDCPPVISREWNRWFSNFVGSALLVVREDRTPLVEVRRAAKLLGNQLKGVLLNASRRSSVSLTTSVTDERIGAGARASKAFEEPVTTSETALSRGS
jgi:Mrp family chromosome partitioning ATPase